MHALDNVIWQALTTRQAPLGENFGVARRFSPEISPLAAFSEPTAEGYDSLAQLSQPGDVAGLFLDEPYAPMPGWNTVREATLLQMVHQNGAHSTDLSVGDDLIQMGAADVPEMMDLTALTKPGPFNPRTYELGTYLGIRRDGKLVAMAGERLKVPGYTEVSAVCSHPEHTGHGYARILMTEVMRRIRSRGETPFLHVRRDNARAIALYQRLGFRERGLWHLAVLRRE
ncbi:MAG: GNAT family N-acetyltransferase [Candidatus Sulfotelmatobacter sp.]